MENVELKPILNALKIEPGGVYVIECETMASWHHVKEHFETLKQIVPESRFILLGPHMRMAREQL